jgi:phosphosulfolactate phosphohydrolase-like enzyme
VRATTTAGILCDRLGGLCAIGSPDHLAQLPASANGYVVFSELESLSTDLPRFDNSPVAAREADLSGRTPVLITTNGTVALAIAAQMAREVVLAGFVNFTAVVDYVQRTKPESVAVMPAGNIHKQQGCIEDDACATALARRLMLEYVDLPPVLASCRANDRIVRRLAREVGFAADLELCLAVDLLRVVPTATRAEPHFQIVPRDLRPDS